MIQRKTKGKIIRRLGILPGLTTKNINFIKTTPGQHGKPVLKQKQSFSIEENFKNCLIEKQILKFNYNITEKQLFSYYQKAKKQNLETSLLLLQYLEMRLDCIVFKLGFAKTIPEARQLIVHGHILVNNFKITIPSFNCKPAYKINIIKPFTKINTILPSYLEMDSLTNTGLILKIPFRTDINLKVNELQVIEYYSR